MHAGVKRRDCLLKRELTILLNVKFCGRRQCSLTFCYTGTCIANIPSIATKQRHVTRKRYPMAVKHDLFGLQTSVTKFLQQSLPKRCSNSLLNELPNFLKIHEILPKVKLFTKSGHTVDCERSLLSPGLDFRACERKEGLQTTHQEMKSALPTQRKIPIGRNRYACKRSNYAINTFQSEC